MEKLDKIQNNLNIIQNNIAKAALKSGRHYEDITLVAVTKSVDIEIAKLVYDLGIKNLGENRVQEFKKKINKIENANWHMIGRLQTNKVKDVVGNVTLIHSLDRWNLAEELNKRAKLLEVDVSVLLQINVAEEEQKAGIKIDDAKHFLESISQLSNLKINGLMTMAPIMENPEGTRPIFSELYQLREKLKNQSFPNVDLKYLSMGMTQDYQIAIEEGANIIRVGSALFEL
ncbi:Pyridoxal phosphate-containing protein YggS [Candidatus Syntrophocurvum alkaliphilum]|uniref:Pyridoxal phosphate homeostasis protein n=1 Tax=Candidatus Syntrophocurvum alkaliphilum TaxID=2293317 RepID=A0A6I6DII9_9FIRM|nr:YggS family pyridoxal phosphate-dependent enzyme [Candidatus Syntrophocurvum alkaliphilum]QGT99694.1 Pyridoxal phosphate-containing protein YggS [Candidatus Syntrophocurvum alkaliphilum]